MPDQPRLARFALAWLLLYACERAAREGPLAAWWATHAVAAPAAALIGWLRPDEAVHALGPRLTWPGGRLQLEAGCDGLELFTLLGAALVAAPLPWHRRLALLPAALALVWALNLARLLALYASFRHAPGSFDLLHTLLAPLLVLGLATLWLLPRLGRST